MVLNLPRLSRREEDDHVGLGCRCGRRAGCSRARLSCCAGRAWLRATHGSHPCWVAAESGRLAAGAGAVGWGTDRGVGRAVLGVAARRWCLWRGHAVCDDAVAGLSGTAGYRLVVAVA